MNENTLAPEQEQQVVPETTPADVTVVEDNNEAGHKVLFFVIMGIVCLSGIGIPVAAIIIWRQHKKLAQYKQQFGDLPKQEKATEAAAPTEEKKEDSKIEK